MEATHKPNILLVMTDDQPYHSLGVMGSVMNRLVEAEERGWHSVRMRKFNETTQNFDNLLYIKWNDGFEELYDYENDPELLDGEINTPREKAHVEDLRQRLETMRTSAGNAYRAVEN